MVICLFVKFGILRFDITVPVTYNQWSASQTYKHFRQMAKKKPVRKSFSPETKVEALRLIREDGYTQNQAAEYAGCSVNAIQNWKVAAKAGKIKVAAQETKNGANTAEHSVKSVKKAKRQQKGSMATTTRTAATGKPQITSDDFVRDYWNKGTRAVDALLLPPEIGQKVIQYVNEALRYAYDQFRK